MFSATMQGLEQKDYEFYGMRNLAKISLKSMQDPKLANRKEENTTKK